LKQIDGGRICISYQEIIMISFVVGNVKPAIQSGEINVEIVVNTCPNDELFLHPSFSFFEPAKLALSIVKGL